jgi:hypothetical protein
METLLGWSRNHGAENRNVLFSKLLKNGMYPARFIVLLEVHVCAFTYLYDERLPLMSQKYALLWKRIICTTSIKPPTAARNRVLYCGIQIIDMTKMMTSGHGPPNVTITASACCSQLLYTWTPCWRSRAKRMIAVLSLATEAEPPSTIGCMLQPQYETAWICRGLQHTPWIVHNNTVWFGRSFFSLVCEVKVYRSEKQLAKFEESWFKLKWTDHHQLWYCHHLPLHHLVIR